MPIIKLDSTLISQIAAGEVLERPACAVRELLDNAIDANASEITVRIESGGLVKIQIEDNGIGIEKEDLPLVFERHATSKIKTFDDLLHVKSLGFRGEAMAAMGSVSNALIETQREGEPTGFKIKCHGGVISDPVAVKGNQKRGTIITLEQLFFHVPARRKFLKTEGYEAQKCREVFLRAAIGRQHTAFSFFKDGKLLHAFKATESAEERVLEVLGSNIGNWHKVEYSTPTGSVRVEGFYAPLKALPAHKEVQYLFVNDRIVKDKSIAHALKEAQISCKEGKDAAYVLWLTMPQEAVDVNAHPAKTQVRFKEPRVLYQIFFNAIKEALGEVQKEQAPSSDFERYQKNQKALGEIGVFRRETWNPKEGGEQEEELFATGAAADGTKSSSVKLQGWEERRGFSQYYGWRIVEAPAGFWIVQSALWDAVLQAFVTSQRLETEFLEGVPFLEPLELVMEAGSSSALLRHQRVLEGLGFELQIAGTKVSVIKSAPEFENVNLAMALGAIGGFLKKGILDAFEVLLPLYLHKGLVVKSEQENTITEDPLLVWDRFLKTQSALEKQNFYQFFPKLS